VIKEAVDEIKFLSWQWRPESVENGALSSLWMVIGPRILHAQIMAGRGVGSDLLWLLPAFLVWCYGLRKVSFVRCRVAFWCSRSSMIFCNLVFVPWSQLPCNAFNAAVVELRGEGGFCVGSDLLCWLPAFLVQYYGLLQVSFVCCRAASWCSRSSMIFCKLVLLHETNCPTIHLLVRLWNYGREGAFVLVWICCAGFLRFWFGVMGSAG